MIRSFYIYQAKVHLTNNWLIKRLESVDSTQQYAKQLITDSNYPSQQIAITSSVQTAGYGRLSREWQSVDGNLHLTLIVPIPSNAKSSSQYSQISYVTGVTIGESISAFILDEFNKKIQYKWVNDILIDEKKVSGMIIEKFHKFFLIGIGVNLMRSPEIAEDDGSTLQFGVTSMLEESKKKISSDVFVEVLLPQFTSLYNQWVDSGFEVLRKMWKSRAYKIGEKIAIKITENQNIEGIFSDIAPDGAIIIETSDGAEKFYAGDFFPLF